MGGLVGGLPGAIWARSGRAKSANSANRKNGTATTCKARGRIFIRDLFPNLLLHGRQRREADWLARAILCEPPARRQKPVFPSEYHLDQCPSAGSRAGSFPASKP